jgi:hypothetical protein
MLATAAGCSRGPLDQQEVKRDEGFERRIKAAVDEIVRKQVDTHVDVINEGEVSKVGYPCT